MPEQHITVISPSVDGSPTSDVSPSPGGGIFQTLRGLGFTALLVENNTALHVHTRVLPPSLKPS